MVLQRLALPAAVPRLPGASLRATAGLQQHLERPLLPAAAARQHPARTRRLGQELSFPSTVRCNRRLVLQPRLQAYTCPVFFADDWLNEWYDERRARPAGRRHAQQPQQAQQQQQQQQQATTPQQGQQQQGDMQPQQGAVQSGAGCGGEGQVEGAREEARSGDDAGSDYRFVYMGPRVSEGVGQRE